MRVKKRSVLFMLALFSLMAWVFSGPAHADGFDVNFYGVVDAGLGYQANAYSVDPNNFSGMNPLAAAKAKQDVLGMFNGGISDSRVGVRGSEELDGGRKFLFQLETGFNLPDGAINNNDLGVSTNGTPVTSNLNSSLSGQLFNRQAWLAMSDPAFGTLGLGRQYNFIFDVLSAYDPVKYAQLFSPLGYSGGFGGGAGVSEDSRVDDDVKWTAKFDNFNVGLAWKVGGISGTTSANAGEQINLGYDNGTFGIQVLAEQHNDAIKAGNPASAYPTVSTACTSVTTTATCATTAQLAATAYNTRDWTAAVKYKFDDAGVVKAGYQQYTLTTASNPQQDAALTSLYGLSANVKAYNGQDQNIEIYFVGGTYNATEKTDLSLGYYYINYDSFGAGTLVSSGGATTAVAAVNNSYATAVSVLLDHNYSKNTDAYLGAIWYSVGGAQFASYASNYNATYGVGLRYKF